MNEQIEQIIVYKRFRLHPNGGLGFMHTHWDCTVQHWPKSVKLFKAPKEMPTCVSRMKIFHDICFIFPGFPLFYLFWDYYIYVISRILERIALLDFTEPWIILNFPLILSSEFRIHLLCTSHWDCILTG